jgi:hypothetical protein
VWSIGPDVSFFFWIEHTDGNSSFFTEYIFFVVDLWADHYPEGRSNSAQWWEALCIEREKQEITGMNLQILGTRGEIEESAPWHRKHSGVLLDGTLLLDVGEEEYLSHNPSCIAITHLHPDHAFFIIKPGKITVPVYAPEAYHNAVNVQEMPDVLNLGSLQVRPVHTHHSKKVRSAAMLVEKGSSKICYTGDLIWINKVYQPLLEGCNLIITDGSYLRKGGMIRKDPATGFLYGHNGIPDLIRLFCDLTDHILFVHFGSWFFKDIVKARKKLDALGKESQVDVQVGYDGMILDTENL